MTATAHTARHSSAAAFGDRAQRIAAALVSNPAFWIVAVGLLFGLPLTRSIQRELPDPPPVLGVAPAFTLTDENGRTLDSADDLRGKLWLVDFVDLESAASGTDRMPIMLKVQHRLRFMGDSVRVLSVSLDPDTATPERMLAFEEQYKPNPQLWSFVSGPDAAGLHDALLAVLRTQHPELPDWTNLRDGNYAVLIDPDMRVRGFYELREENLDAMLLDMGIIANLYGPDDRPAESNS